MRLFSLGDLSQPVGPFEETGTTALSVEGDHRVRLATARADFHFNEPRRGLFPQGGRVKLEKESERAVRRRKVKHVGNIPPPVVARTPETCLVRAFQRITDYFFFPFILSLFFPFLAAFRGVFERLALDGESDARRPSNDQCENR